MRWSHQFNIAGLVIQVDSDSDACEQDMHKFLKLYEVVNTQPFDLRFSVVYQDDAYHFISEDKAGAQQELWVSQDAREVTAALEVHLYSQVVQLLDKLGVQSIHSSLLNVAGQAVMFAGVSGTGKSSLCTAGLLAGARYFSDEFSLLDEQGYVHPFPRPMQWEHETHPAFKRSDVEQSGHIDADYFDFPDAQGGITRCFLWHPLNVQRETLALKHIVLHQYDASLTQAKLSEIPRHEALVSLPEHLHVQRGMAKDLPMLNARIHQDCKFYRLHFPNVFQAWELIEAELNASASPAVT